MRKYRPGKLTRRLRAALGISGSTIPPFVQNMQRYGPPLRKFIFGISNSNQS